MTKRRKPKQKEATAREMRRVTVVLPEDLCQRIEHEAERQSRLQTDGRIVQFTHVMRVWLRERAEVTP